MEGLRYCRHRARGNVRNPAAPPPASTNRSFYVEDGGDIRSFSRASSKRISSESCFVSGKERPCKASCGRDEAGLECRPSMRQRAFHKRGPRDGVFHARDMASRARRSKLRKRVNDYAGCKTAPPAFLAAAKIAGFKPGRPGYRLCGATQARRKPVQTTGHEGLQGVREPWRHSRVSQAGKVSAERANRGVQGEPGGDAWRSGAASAFRISCDCRFTGSPMNGRGCGWRGRGGRRLGCRWCGKFNHQDI